MLNKPKVSFEQTTQNIAPSFEEKAKKQKLITTALSKEIPSKILESETIRRMSEGISCHIEKLAEPAYIPGFFDKVTKDCFQKLEGQPLGGIRGLGLIIVNNVIRTYSTSGTFPNRDILRFTFISINDRKVSVKYSMSTFRKGLNEVKKIDNTSSLLKIAELFSEELNLINSCLPELSSYARRILLLYPSYCFLLIFFI